MASDATGRILLLTQDSDAARLLAGALDDAVGLAGIVVEARRPARLKRRLRRILGRRLYPPLYGLFTGLRYGRLERRLRAVEATLRDAAAHELNERAGGEPAWPPGAPILRTADVNRDATAAWCRGLRPDLFVLFAVSILRAPMLALPRRGALNVHTSLLPEYRGPWPEFWQVFDGATAAAGVTVHVASERLDCGDLVLQRASAPAPGLDPYRLRTRNVLLAREIVPAAARAYLTNAVAPRPQGAARTRTHRVRDRTRSKRAALLRRLGHPI